MNGRRNRDVNASSSSAPVKVPANDDDATRKAILDVVQVWLDRLQLISVIVSVTGLSGPYRF